MTDRQTDRQTDKQTDQQTDRQTKFTLRSLERGSLTLAPIKETSQLAGKGYKDSDYTLVIAIVQ